MIVGSVAKKMKAQLLCVISKENRLESWVKLMENPFKWQYYEGEIILLYFRWYLQYELSYRDLKEMMSERGLSLVHTTIYRWVQRFAPDLDKRMRPHLKKSNDSW